MSLIKADQKKLDTFGFNPFSTDVDPDDRTILTVSIFQYALNAKGDGLKHASSGVQVRGERGQAAKILKVVKATVKALNEGTFNFGGKDKTVVTVPTGRPKGRPKLVAAAA
jgi:hypothetical protein